MNRLPFLRYPSWLLFSKKVHSRMAQPLYVGSFHAEDAVFQNARLITAQEGYMKEGQPSLRLHWLIDENDGIIMDACFRAFGPPALIAAADLACEIMIQKNYDQARRISAEIIDKKGRDKEEKPAFPEEAGNLLNIVLFTIEEAADQCSDIPFADTYISSPIDAVPGIEGNGHPHWKEFTLQQKLAFLKEIVANDILPYVQLDAGGVEILDLIDEREVVIAYQGSCTSCHSATGSTLTAIQQILRAKASPDLIVTPDLSLLR